MITTAYRPIRIHFKHAYSSMKTSKLRARRCEILGSQDLFCRRENSWSGSTSLPMIHYHHLHLSTINFKSGRMFTSREDGKQKKSFPNTGNDKIDMKMSGMSSDDSIASNSAQEDDGDDAGMTKGDEKKNIIKVWEFHAGNHIASEASAPTKDSEGSFKPRKEILYIATSENTKFEKVPQSKLKSSANSTSATKDSSTQKIILDTLQNNILQHFLPAGYPNAVSPTYTTFAAYNFIASTAGTTAMVLSTQTLLLAVGVGSTSAAPMAAALNWVIKDGVGQLGGVLFASKLGTTTSTGSSIDSDPKRWRMVSALSLDAATLLEIASPLFPHLFLPIASLANVGKNIGFLTASASRAALHQSLALRSNLGDVTAKAGSQSIAASLVGTGFGILLSPLLGGQFGNVVWGFVGLSGIHQFCTYMSLKAVALKDLNRHRLNLVLDLYIKDLASRIHENDDNEANENKLFVSSIFRPEVIAQHESFLPFTHPDDSHAWLNIGCRLNDLCPDGLDQLSRLRRDCIGMDEKYILSFHIVRDNISIPMNVNDIQINLTFLERATDKDIIRGMFHAHCIRSSVLENLIALSPTSPSDDTFQYDVVANTHKFMEEHCESLMENLESLGWNIGMDCVRVESGLGYRLRIEDNHDSTT